MSSCEVFLLPDVGAAMFVGFPAEREKRANAKVDPFLDIQFSIVQMRDEDVGIDGYFSNTFFTSPILFSTLPFHFSAVPSS